MSSNLYMKNSSGEYIPVEIEKIANRDWENKIILVRIGTEQNPATEKEEEEMYVALEKADALDHLENTTFVVTLYEVDFEVLGSLKEIGDKCVAVSVRAGDDFSKLGDLQKRAKAALREHAKKVAILPTPLTVNEYKEVMDIKRRCDTRRNRRGQ